MAFYLQLPLLLGVSVMLSAISDFFWIRIIGGLVRFVYFRFPDKAKRDEVDLLELFLFNNEFAHIDVATELTTQREFLMAAVEKDARNFLAKCPKHWADLDLELVAKDLAEQFYIGCLAEPDGAVH